MKAIAATYRKSNQAAGECRNWAGARCFRIALLPASQVAETQACGAEYSSGLLTWGFVLVWLGAARIGGWPASTALSGW
jgi:hypothetical protein